MPLVSWEKLIKAIKRIKPKLSDEIDRLLMLKKISSYILKGYGVDLLIQEREAFGISLDIFEGGGSGLRKAVLGGWTPNNDDIKITSEKKKKAELKKTDKLSFISGISKRYIQEETALQNACATGLVLVDHLFMGIRYLKKEIDL